MQIWSHLIFLCSYQSLGKQKCCLKWTILDLYATVSRFYMQICSHLIFLCSYRSSNQEEQCLKWIILEFCIIVSRFYMQICFHLIFLPLMANRVFVWSTLKFSAASCILQVLTFKNAQNTGCCKKFTWFPYCPNFLRNVTFTPVGLVISHPRESGCMYSHSKAREKLNAKRHSHFISECSYVVAAEYCQVYSEFRARRFVNHNTS